MKTLFERLSKENQDKIMKNDLTRLHFKNTLKDKHFIHEITFDVACHINRVVYDKNKIDPIKFNDLFNNN